MYIPFEALEGEHKLVGFMSLNFLAGGRGTQATVSDLILKLRELTGRVSVNELIAALGTLKSFDSKRAAELGSAYFSMLRRSNRNIGNAFAGLFEHIERKQGKRPIKPCWGYRIFSTERSSVTGGRGTCACARSRNLAQSGS